MQTNKTKHVNRMFALLPALAGAALPLVGAAALPLATARPALAAERQTPGELVGTWGFTTISGTTYWDKSTGAYLGDGNGGAQSYTFAKDGTYKLFNYVKTNSYGWEVKALTWEEGKASFHGPTVTLRPTSGRYQVMDSSVKKNNYRRPMRPEERKTKTYQWRLERQGGKPVLMMGRGADSLTAYQRQK